MNQENISIEFYSNFLSYSSLESQFSTGRFRFLWKCGFQIFSPSFLSISFHGHFTHSSLGSQKQFYGYFQHTHTTISLTLSSFSLTLSLSLSHLFLLFVSLSLSPSSLYVWFSVNVPRLIISVEKSWWKIIFVALWWSQSDQK